MCLVRRRLVSLGGWLSVGCYGAAVPHWSDDFLWVAMALLFCAILLSGGGFGLGAWKQRPCLVHEFRRICGRYLLSLC
jgi:hypothetical protein